MADMIDYNLKVLASSAEEINCIAARLEQPSSKLVEWVAQRFNERPNEAAEHVRTLVSFEPVAGAFTTEASVNRARHFHNSIKDRTGIDVHLLEISSEFPAAMFLVLYSDMGYSGKMVIRAGAVIQELHDGNKRSQWVDWALLDIFAPFVAEWSLGREFGSLWAEWLEDITETIGVLRSRRKLYCE